MWREDADIDFGYHVRRIEVAAAGGRRELDEVIGKIASTPLDRSHPLWGPLAAGSALNITVWSATSTN